MKVKILHQSWSVGGKVWCEGEETETDDPNIIAFAIGLNRLGKPRMTNDGLRVNGDHRACEALTEATAEERQAAEEFIASQKPIPRRGFGREGGAAASLKLDPESITTMATAIASALVAAGVVPAPKAK